MADMTYRYIIVGGGLAGASAAKGIRDVDADGSILLLGNERHKPYHRPPLTKGLWSGKKQVEEIGARKDAFYTENRVELQLDTEVVALDAGAKTLRDGAGTTYHFDKLLLATGGVPRRLDIPGGDLDGLYYYRCLDDYFALRPQATEGRSALVVGGGFIGSEIAAALHGVGVHVTMLYPEPSLVARVFPESLGRAVQADYERRGITIVAGNVPAAIEKSGATYVVRTKNGQTLGADMVIIGAGIRPATALAEGAGLALGNGVQVNATLQTSHPDIYAAGDNAEFPYEALGERMRIEHWDNALNSGKQAGRNMAGAGEPYTYMPYFFSDLFDFGYEAVGEVDSRLDTFADWQEEYKTGVIYYLRDGFVRGVMLCNIWEKVDAARELIRRGEKVSPDALRGAIG